MRREAGFFLVHALFLLVLASALAGVLLDRGRSVQAAASADVAQLQALEAAEGGLALARHALAADPIYRGGLLRIGACEVEVRLAPAPGGWKITAIARPGSVRLEQLVANSGSSAD